MNNQNSPPVVTHLWCESPLMDHVAALLPGDWMRIEAASPPDVPWSNAGPAQAILASSLIRYSGAVMDAFPNLRIIARTGIGVDNVDLAAATERGIVVTNTPDGPTESTAEHTVAMLLALAKRLPQGAANFAAGKWGPRSGPLMGTEVRGKTLGLVGFGRIGRRVAEICRLAFSMRVLAYDPIIPAEQAASMGVELAELDRVLSEAHFLSLHAPATPETHKLMNTKRLGQMRRGSYLLNLARGSLVDEAALLEALDSGHLAGAGLDVFDPEPPSVDSRLRNHPAVVATPHMASVTFEGRERMEQMAVECLLAFARGSRPPSVVNPAVYRD